MNTKITKRLIAVLIFFLLLHNTTVFSNTEKKHNPINQIKKSVVFLGTVNEKGEKKPCATGFLVNVQGVYHLVTAKHVVMENKDGKFTGKLIDDGLCAFFNTKDKGVGLRSIEEIKNKFSLDWMFHDNNDVDIAVIPFGLDIENDDVMTIPDDLFLDSMDSLFELYDIFFLSYQPGIGYQKKISPVTRAGTISLINDDKTFYVDAFAFPGNSGSPLFLKPSPIRFDEERIAIGGDKLGWKFAGIIGEYIPYRETAISLQTGRPRVIFEENTGLTKVWSVNFIKEIIESKEFKNQITKLQSSLKKAKSNL